MTRNQTELETPSFRNNITFFVFGFCTYILVSVKFVIAEDVLADSVYPTTVVFTCGMGPWFLTTLIFPYFINKVSYSIRVLFIAIFGTGGLLLISLCGVLAVKLLGVCFTSLSCGMSAVTFIPLTAFYRESTVKAYTAGTGCGLCFGTFYYAVLTSWACVSSETTLLTEVCAPVLLLTFYAFFLRKKQPKPTAGEAVTSPLLPVAQDKTHPPLLCNDKLMAIRQTLRYVLPFYIGVLSQFVILQSVVTTMAFPNDLFHPRDLYQFYVFAFVLGNFISRSYRVILSLFRNGSTLLIRPTWILSMCLVAVLIFLSVCSWYRSPQSAWMVGGVLLGVGLLAGLLYTSTFTVVGEDEPPSVKEFCRAFTTVASVSGALTAGFLGLFLEHVFLHHCTSVEKHNQYCYTRIVGKFNTTVKCDWGK
ncbi:protein BTN1-like [Actinia tenebrosa]|uniref:Battenin n=1 Tax=Actinia tenebrosa TaxID=6105 RepID=A0A6P8ITQ2_ACTTE|nr:protein BTN1-like [Actinia tenebrosa]XP_031570405.1 protein BTN1-like [Actinia tenebrosa]XP_031570406.1 protein BTN1-like [Actinia tenebrosa]